MGINQARIVLVEDVTKGIDLNRISEPIYFLYSVGDPPINVNTEFYGPVPAGEYHVITNLFVKTFGLDTDKIAFFMQYPTVYMATVDGMVSARGYRNDFAPFILDGGKKLVYYLYSGLYYSMSLSVIGYKLAV